jgi:predicted RNase H-like HicB family nuclease
MKARARIPMEESIEIEAIVHEEDGSFWAEVSTCPGLFASGETLDELADAVREAWLLYHDGYQRQDAHDGEARKTGVTSALTLRVPAFA